MALQIRYRDLFRRRDIALLALVGVANAASVAGLLLLLREFVRSLTGHSVLGIAPEFILFLLAAVALIHAALRGLEFFVPEQIGFRIVQRLRVAIYRHMAAMMPNQIRHRSRGSLILRLTGDLTMLRTWLSRGIGRGLIAGLSLLAAMAVIASFNLAMAAAIGAVLAFGGWASVSAGRYLQMLTARVRRRRSTLTSNIDEQVHNLATVQLFGRSNGEDARLRRQNEALTSALVQEGWWRGLLRAVSAATGWGALVVALFVGFLLLRHGGTDVGTIVSAVIATRLMQGFVTSLSLSHDYWRRAEISRRKLEDFLNSRSRLLSGDGTDRLTQNRATIRFENVSLAGKLSGVTAALSAGRHAVLTGSDTAARQALLDAVARLVDLDAGRILIGSQDIADCTAESVWKKLGIISPDLPLMRGTLRRNLSYRHPDMDERELHHIAGLVGLQDLIASLPGGLDFWLTEGGANLPADARQLVRIARGLGGNPPMLLIDRLTTGLHMDQAETVRSIVANYAATIFSISDDKADIREADEVWTFHDGQLAMIESRDEFEQRERLPTIGRAQQSGWF